MDVSSQVHPADKPVGIVLIVLNALGVCGGVLLVAGGGIIGAVGGAAGAAGAAGSSTAEEKAAGAAVGTAAAAGGGLIMILGIATLLICAISIYGAIGIMQSRKQGFTITLILGVIGLLLNIAGMLSGSPNLVGLGLGILAPLFAFLRLNGQLPPKVEV
jgi:hypothetical protein